MKLLMHYGQKMLIKTFDISMVSQQRELLIPFMYWFNKDNEGSGTDWIDIEEIDTFLEENNCV